MKREGRMHGSILRVGRRQLDCGQKLPSKPTNQSKTSTTHAIVDNSNLIFTEYELPSQKSIGKTKSAWKAKGLDITRNHLMEDWKIYERDHRTPDAISQQQSRNNLRDHWECDREGEDVTQGDDDQETEASGRPAGIVLPIEILIHQRKSSKAALGASSLESPNEGTHVTNGDDVLSWYDLEFLEDHMVEEWFLVTGAEYS